MFRAICPVMDDLTDGGAVQAAQQPEQSGLACPVAADQSYDVPRLNSKVTSCSAWTSPKDLQPPRTDRSGALIGRSHSALLYCFIQSGMGFVDAAGPLEQLTQLILNLIAWDADFHHVPEHRQSPLDRTGCEVGIVTDPTCVEQLVEGVLQKRQLLVQAVGVQMGQVGQPVDGTAHLNGRPTDDPSMTLSRRTSLWKSTHQDFSSS